MTAKEKAKELIVNNRAMLSLPNAPLGHHKDELAKELAIDKANLIIEILETIVKPEYVAFICKDTYTVPETEYETHLHGYELLIYWQEVKNELNQF
jgi:hypothetical protein